MDLSQIEKIRNKKILDEIEKVRIWYIEYKPLIKKFFNYKNLVNQIEYMPSIFIAIFKNKKLQENILTDYITYAFFQNASHTFITAVSELEKFLNYCNSDYDLLNTFSEEINLYLLMSEIVNYEFIDTGDKQYQEIKKSLSEFRKYIELIDRILSLKKKISDEDASKIRVSFEKFYKANDNEFEPINEMCYELTLNLQIPMHNLDI